MTFGSFIIVIQQQIVWRQNCSNETSILQRFYYFYLFRIQRDKYQKKKLSHRQQQHQQDIQEKIH